MWQWFGGGRRLVAGTFLNVPGLPDHEIVTYIISIQMGPHGNDGAAFYNNMLYANIIGQRRSIVPAWLSKWGFMLNAGQNYTWAINAPYVGLVRRLQLYVAPYSTSEDKIDYM